MKVILPEQLRKLANNEFEINVSIAEFETVRASLNKLEEAFNGFDKRLFNRGNLNPFVNIYVNGEDIRFLAGLETLVSNEDELSIVPAVAGG